MDLQYKIIFTVALSGIITFSVSIFYLPSTSRTVPPGVDPQEFMEQERQMVINSTPFKIMIVGICMTVATIIYIFIMKCFNDEYKVEQEPPQIIIHDLKPILKRSVPSVSVPSVSVASTLVTPSNSSPPAQLVPGQKVKFQYPPPYEIMNR